MVGGRRAAVREGGAEGIRKATGAEVMTVVADAAQPEDMPRFIEETVKRYGRIDAVVNNAGGTGQRSFDVVDDEAWQNDIDIKVFAQIRTAQIGEEPLGRRRNIAENADLVPGQFRQALEFGDDAVVVVGDRDDHRRSLADPFPSPVRRDSCQNPCPHRMGRSQWNWG